MDELQPTPDPVVEHSELIFDEPFYESEPARVREGGGRGFDLKLFFVLLAASLVGSLAVLPFSRTLIKQMQPPIVPEALLPLALAITVVVELFISAAAIGVGLAIGPPVNLGRLFVPSWSTGYSSGARRFWVVIGEPLALGMTMGAIMSAFAWNLHPAAGDPAKLLITPTPWEGFLGSIGAGIREEIWLRLGLMTFLVGLGAFLVRRFGRRNEEPPAPVVWIANLLAALIFAAIHIPQTKALIGLSTEVVLFIFFGNGLPGLVFGWLYWRRGLVTAMLAHFGLDLVLKVLLPLLS